MFQYRIEIVHKQNINNGQPYRRLVRILDGSRQIVDEDSIEYVQSQEQILSGIEGEVLIDMNIGLGHLLLSALSRLKITAVYISTLPKCESEQAVLDMVKEHHKFKGLPTVDIPSITQQQIRERYRKILTARSATRKRIGKFI